jgi:hypothetical protein
MSVSATTTLQFAGPGARTRADAVAESLRPGLTARMGPSLWMRITASQVVEAAGGWQVLLAYEEMSEAEQAALR